MNDLMCDPKQARPLKAALAEDSTAAFFVQQMSKQLFSSGSSEVSAKSKIHTLVFIPAASLITGIRGANQWVIGAQAGNAG